MIAAGFTGGQACEIEAKSAEIEAFDAILDYLDGFGSVIETHKHNGYFKGPTPTFSAEIGSDYFPVLHNETIVTRDILPFKTITIETLGNATVCHRSPS